MYTAAASKVKGNNNVASCVLAEERPAKLILSLCIDTNTLIMLLLSCKLAFYLSLVDVACVQFVQVDRQVIHFTSAKVAQHMLTPH